MVDRNKFKASQESSENTFFVPKVRLWSTFEAERTPAAASLGFAKWRKLVQQHNQLQFIGWILDNHICDSWAGVGFPKDLPEPPSSSHIAFQPPVPVPPIGRDNHKKWRS